MSLESRVPIQGYGLSIPAPPGWHVAITRRYPGSPPEAGTPRGGLAVRAVDAVGLRGPSGEVTYPVLHAATVPLAGGRGDFGTGVVDVLGPNDVFVALIEYGSQVADEGLFAPQGIPRLAPSQFHPDRLQRAIPGRSAAQHFFSDGGRAFCLFAVVGAHSRRMATVPAAAALVRQIQVADRRSLLAAGGTR